MQGHRRACALIVYDIPALTFFTYKAIEILQAFTAAPKSIAEGSRQLISIRNNTKSRILFRCHCTTFVYQQQKISHAGKGECVHDTWHFQTFYEALATKTTTTTLNWNNGFRNDTGSNFRNARRNIRCDYCGADECTRYSNLFVGSNQL